MFCPLFSHLTPLNLKLLYLQAIKSRKVFRLDGGHRYLRKALKARGWVEKFTNRTKRFQTGDEGDDPVDFVDDPIDDMKDIETKEEPQEIKGTLPLDEMEKLVSRFVFHFQWTVKAYFRHVLLIQFRYKNA